MPLIDDLDAANAICKTFIAVEGIEPDEDFNWLQYVQTMRTIGFEIVPVGAADLRDALSEAVTFFEGAFGREGDMLVRWRAALSKASQQQGSPQAPVAPDSEATSK